MESPTKETYSSLNRAYEFFNHSLFSGSLPACLITVQRAKNSYGYFSASRFINTQNAKEIRDEIALNPAHFGTRSTEKVLATMVHEMVHLWQHHLGKPPRKGYHDRQWAAKMREVGLIPSSTGEEGGKDVGQKVSHYIEEGGIYDRAFKQFTAAHPTRLYHDRATEAEAKVARKKAASKSKYTCPDCEQNCWAKPEANLVCGDCDAVMVTVDA